MHNSNQSENYSQISEDNELQVEYFKGIQRQDSSIQYLKNIEDENFEKQIFFKKEQVEEQSEAQISYKKGNSTSQKTSENYSENFSQINPLNRDFDQSRGLTRQREAGDIQADTSRSSVRQQAQYSQKNQFKLNANNFSIDQVQKQQKYQKDQEVNINIKYQEQLRKLNLDKDSEIFTAKSMSYEDLQIKEDNDESQSLEESGVIVYNNIFKNEQKNDFIKIHQEITKQPSEQNMTTQLEELKSMHKKRANIESEVSSFAQEKKRRIKQMPQVNDILNKEIDKITFTEKRQIQINKQQKPTSPNLSQTKKIFKNNYQKDLLQNFINEQNKIQQDQKIYDLEKQKSRSRLSFSASQNIKPYMNKLLNQAQEQNSSSQNKQISIKQQMNQLYNISPNSHFQKDDLNPVLQKNQIISNQDNMIRSPTYQNTRQSKNLIIKPSQSIYNSQKYFDSATNLLSTKVPSNVYLNASQISGQASINSNLNSLLGQKIIQSINYKPHPIKNFHSPESFQNFTQEEIKYLNQQA